jgi:cytochrome b561
MTVQSATLQPGPAGYSASQIVLHWIIAALVVFQLAFGGMMGPAYRAFRRGTKPAAADLFAANVHVCVGIAVLVLAVWRFALRLTRGVPALPAGEGPVTAWLARIAHFLLYLFIFGMPVTGMLAWFGMVEQAGEFHETMKPVIILVVFLHAAGALWQHFGARTDVLRRMLRPVGS